MKKYLIILFVLVIPFTSCDEDFLERIPETDITAQGFFNSVKDLETYSNGFYDYFGAGSRDLTTDDQTRYSEGDELASKLKGVMNPSNVGGWSSWGTLRNINYFLTNYNVNIEDADNDPEVKHFVGFARLVRAKFYIGLIRRYGKAPWFDKPLNVDDEELLYKGHDTREFIVEKIMEDLEYAAQNIKETASLRSKITKWAALAEMSRFCLYEGTFRKYHTELGLSNHADFLTRAASAAKEIMDSGKFGIYSTGKPEQDYNDLFKQDDLSANNEVILQIEYQKGDPSRTHNTVVYFYWGLSKSLADSYLMTDGTKFTDTPNYDEKPYATVFENRDPRMKQTMMYPGYVYPNDEIPYVVKATYGGYTQQKFLHDDKENSQWSAPTDMAAYRYAEVLLNYAEAKAEQGTISQEDIDVSIKPIRDRVNMPNMSLAESNSQPDRVQADYYPNVDGVNKGVILEIRRERRVELACEGYREDDMYRWKCGTTLAQPQLGMYVPELGAMDVTGDGVEDIAILNSASETGPIDGLSDEVKSRLVMFYLGAGGFGLTEGNKGFITMNSDVDQPKSFIDPQYYYYPIPLSHLVVNENLTQPEGW